ncbi:hypothetical protein SAMD00019534_091620 [Acytostelium subglobosum LB1]|uniref:hypothetical protein n=1 Tax=Acytostelium subglobosum LB1 TaxID=1410327 RepID=UPI000644B084|nr:hypothetical protein SAMD00019534_091620 [Acytostelium subglobosum LB1]GAM25987.1 hypothetical protein SAMD00019534_091620 [Acytostelium subglobosum LB1]|eukprot:XP_012751030.1 hypothetical protein SAMD00019534_091620 [Acytostelium subglobosum LB1]
MTSTLVDYPRITDVSGKDTEELEASEMGKRVVDAIKKNPMQIIPFCMMCNALDIKDPFQVVADIKKDGLKVDKEDINIIFQSVIGCIPVIGSLMQGVFQLFWKRASPADEVTKEELDKKLSELKKEIIGIIDSKIKDSEIRMWTDICGTVLENLRGSCGDMKSDLAALVYKLEHNEVIKADFLSDIRTKIALVRDHSRALKNFCANPKYLQFVVKFYVEALFVDISLHGLINAFWYQLNYDEIFVSGRKPDKLSPNGVKSNSEKLHEKITRGLSLIAYHAHPNDGYDGFKDTAHLLLKSDVFMYPVPLIMYNGANDKEMFESIPEDGVPEKEIKLPNMPSAYIMRMDGRDLFRHSFNKSGLGDYRMERGDWVEPITLCQGNPYSLVEMRNYIITLDQPRNITLRFYGQYENDQKIIELTGSDGDGNPFKFELNPIKYKYGALRSYPQGNTYDGSTNQRFVFKSGFAVSKTFKNVTIMDFKITAMSYQSHLFFVEFMVVPEPSIIAEAAEGDQEEDEEEEEFGEEDQVQEEDENYWWEESDEDEQ